MTPQQVQEVVLIGIGEPEGIFHTTDSVNAYIQHGEELLGMLRALTEKSALLSLNYGQIIYPIHSSFVDFIYPLYVTLNKKQLERTTLAKITDNNPEWMKSVGEPKKFFMVGATQIGIYPASPSTSLRVNVTYIASPPALQGTGTYVVGPEWHEALVSYASAILLAKEHKYDIATQQLRSFLEKSGIPRDVRFGPAETKGSRAQEPLHPSSEVAI